MSGRGATKGSESAQRIGAAHRGGHEHDRHGGFAADPEKAREVGRMGGLRLRDKYGREHFVEMGRAGGRRILETRGKDYLAEIARRGGLKKAANGLKKRE